MTSLIRKQHHPRVSRTRSLGAAVLQAAGKTISLRDHKIPHCEILRTLQGCSDASRGLIEMYRQEVLPQRTRTIRLVGRKSAARIIRTLLGYEVQAFYKRIHCPDLVTARYLRLFSELGCHSIKLPYDPTITARLIPDLEATVERVVNGIHELFPQNDSLQQYVVRKVYEIIRGQLRAA